MHLPTKNALLVAIIGLSTTTSLAAPQAEVDVFEAVKGLKRAPNGYLHYADDGVARTYDTEGNVIDYVRLSNKQLMGLLSSSSLPESYLKEMDHFHAVWDSIDGHNVVHEEQLRNPPASLRPLVQTEAGKAQSRNVMRDVDSMLETRQPLFCAGQPCVGDAGCRFMGCSGCAMLDAILPGGSGFCMP